MQSGHLYRLAAGFAFACLTTVCFGEEFSQKQNDFFVKEVRPILQDHCVKCHGAGESIRGSLRLTSRESILRGGDLGPAVLLEAPEESMLLQAVKYESLEMPPSGKLPQAKIDVLVRWIEMGLPFPEKLAEHAEEEEEIRIDENARNWWAYQPLNRPVPPLVKDDHWPRSALDRFVLSKLKEAGVSPNSPAKRLALVRRVYYDLLGLPPTPSQADEFVSDDRADAYERLLDRLLASPQYGEKWGRHWLDLVRFAETHGYERDSPKPSAWRYRDYVIESFNEDKPYDRFLMEQLAGDEMEEASVDSIVATGYYRLGIWDDEPADRPLALYNMFDDLVSTTSQVMLGMTVGCARCHDHKKDPIPQADYYRLLAFFRDVTYMDKENLKKVATDEQRLQHQARLEEKRRREARLYQDIYTLRQKFAVALKDELGLQTSFLPPSDLVDLKYRFYRDTWDSLPSFDALKPETTGRIASNFITLAPASRQEAIGLVFDGKLQVPTSGRYTFFMESTEGVRLSIDGKTIAERPRRGPHRIEADVELSAGLLPLRLDYFNRYDKPNLKIDWSGPNLARRPLSATASWEDETVVLAADAREKPQRWRYTFSEPAGKWIAPDFNPKTWKTGSGGFGKRRTPGAVVRTRWTTPDIWMRRTFRSDGQAKQLALDLRHDEAVEVYLNGVLVHKSTGRLAAYQRVHLAGDTSGILREGENVLAVHCRQAGGGQYVDVGLVDAPKRVDLDDLIRQRGNAALGEKLTGQYLNMVDELARSRKTPVPEPGIDVMCVFERGRADTHILVRGNPALAGDKVEPGFPQVLASASPADLPDVSPGAPSSKKRLTLAKWIANDDNPLTARVFANRLWQHHFGRGIVPTTSDFGKLGEMPTHPRLLDWLASELEDGNWRVKRMHLKLMQSATYRMSSADQQGAMAVDPDNRLLWRYDMRRLTAEEIRDSILAVSGSLNLKAGGPSIYPKIPAAVLAGQSRPGSGWHDSPPAEAARRSVYVHVKRSLRVPILEMHDAPESDLSCAVRFATTVPTQSLGMLNGDFTLKQAKAFAERLQREAPADLTAQVRRAIRLTTSRLPNDDEVKQDVAAIEQWQQEAELSDEQALTYYCLLALNTNEFVYLD